MRRLLVPAAMTVVMLAILLGLGVWQLQRRAWKGAILAQIAASEAAPGQPLGVADPPAFAHVRAVGRWRDDLSALYGVELRGTEGGAHLVTPLLRDAGPPVLVDRGWIDLGAPRPPAPPGPVAVDGWVHPADHPHWFSAADDVAGRRFFTLDPAAIGAALGLKAVAPYVLVALGPPAVPDPARTLPRPPNDHLQYALTWFAFAVTLVVVFVLHARRVLRS